MNSFADTIPWPTRSEPLRLAGNEIHVWAVPLNVASGPLEHFIATLSSEEKQRAERFKFDQHRNRFIAGRGALREILGTYLETMPAKLNFTYSTNGKPALADEFANAGIHFNLAHSADLALIAATHIGRFGVDVECVRPVKDVADLVARFFSPRENDLFQKLDPDQRSAAFFNLWTRKEALLKATGEGITRSLNLVEVSFLPGETAHLLAISGDTAKAAQWSLCELMPAAGFTGAVAVEARDVSVQCGKWASTGTHQ